jgi:hypothetical protein
VTIDGTSRIIICHIWRPSHSGTVVSRDYAAQIAESHTEHRFRFPLRPWFGAPNRPSLHSDSPLAGVGSLDSSSIQFPPWIVDGNRTILYPNVTYVGSPDMTLGFISIVTALMLVLPACISTIYIFTTLPVPEDQWW